jgi:hypothetical protein
MLLTIFLLTYGYAIRVAKMTKTLARGLQRLAVRLRDKSVSVEDDWFPVFRGAKGDMFRTILWQPILIAILRVAHVNLELFTSFLAEVPLTACRLFNPDASC